ncbi:MAG: 16S rRNA (cytidine(1402)-2'-O)-methyltransferase [Schwartzia sp.]|nr:16S rRNA (cytidine(1402)-2'-O)-methyltransferase [Schwartzia sp. (in: firmicutes)]
MDSITERGGEKKIGTLYLCATPIGNLEDMTYRAVRILGEVPLIAAEDTRRTRQLLTHFGLSTRMVSYHEHNKTEKGPRLIEWLLAGNDLACVSDAGLPGIADPGSQLAADAIAAGVEVVPIPGANAAISALIASGLDTTRFSFVGFLPRTKEKRRACLAEISGRTDTLIFYEAPHRLADTLKAILAALGNRPAVLARELTKKFEEFRRGSLSELLDGCVENPPRGEFVVVVGGKENAAEEASQATPEDAAEIVRALTAQGMAKKEAMREAAKKTGLSRRDVYQAMLRDERETP